LQKFSVPTDSNATAVFIFIIAILWLADLAYLLIWKWTAMKGRPTGLIGQLTSAFGHLMSLFKMKKPHDRESRRISRLLSTKDNKIAAEIGKAYKDSPQERDGTQNQHAFADPQSPDGLLKPKQDLNERVGFVLSLARLFLTKGRFFVFRKFAATLFEAASQTFLAIKCGELGVPAYVLIPHMVVIFFSLQTPWFLTSKSTKMRQVNVVLAEIVVGLSYLSISLAAFFVGVSAFEHRSTGECLSPYFAGFGSFAYGCYDVVSTCPSSSPTKE
jgi:hypothetical protein